MQMANEPNEPNEPSSYRKIMCWLYADQKFVVPQGSPWASFLAFGWMKNRPAPFAHAWVLAPQSQY